MLKLLHEANVEVVVPVPSYHVPVEAQMKTTLVKKNVAALVLATVITLPTMAQGLTDGSIPCQDVAKNESAYGCGMEDENVSNRKYKCLKALGQFHVPLDGENRFHKPGKIKQGEKMVAVSKDENSIVFGDEEKDFKVSKEKIKAAIASKYGEKAKEKEKYKVTFQTLKGKITLAFKKKAIEGGQGGGFGIGKWDRVEENSSEDNVLITLGNKAHQDAETSNSLDNMKQDLDEKVSSFPNKVDQKVEEIEKKYQEKKQQVDQNSDLATMEKIAMKRKIEAEKRRKKDLWLRKKRNAQALRAHALRKCMGQGKMVSENVLRQGGFGNGEAFGQSVAGTVSQ